MNRIHQSFDLKNPALRSGNFYLRGPNVGFGIEGFKKRNAFN